MDHSDITNALRAAGADVFQDRRNDALSRAIDCLEGRTHYVDEGTRKYFSARVLSCQLVFSGAFLRLTESTASGFNNPSRVFRVVMFDVFGAAVWRPTMEQSSKTHAAAEKQFWVWFETFNPAQYYAGVLAERAERLARESAELKKAARAMNRLKTK